MTPVTGQCEPCNICLWFLNRKKYITFFFQWHFIQCVFSTEKKKTIFSYFLLFAALLRKMLVSWKKLYRCVITGQCEPCNICLWFLNRKKYITFFFQWHFIQCVFSTEKKKTIFSYFLLFAALLRKMLVSWKKLYRCVIIHVS